MHSEAEPARAYGERISAYGGCCAACSGRLFACSVRLLLTAGVFWIAADFFRSLCLPTRSLSQLMADAVQLTLGAAGAYCLQRWRFGWQLIFLEACALRRGACHSLGRAQFSFWRVHGGLQRAPFRLQFATFANSWYLLDCSSLFRCLCFPTRDLTQPMTGAVQLTVGAAGAYFLQRWHVELQLCFKMLVPFDAGLLTAMAF